MINKIFHNNNTLLKTAKRSYFEQEISNADNKKNRSSILKIKNYQKESSKTSADIARNLMNTS